MFRRIYWDTALAASDPIFRRGWLLHKDPGAKPELLDRKDKVLV
jgi:hypothetical protein